MHERCLNNQVPPHGWNIPALRDGRARSSPGRCTHPGGDGSAFCPDTTPDFWESRVKYSASALRMQQKWGIPIARSDDFQFTIQGEGESTGEEGVAQTLTEGAEREAHEEQGSALTVVDLRPKVGRSLWASMLLLQVILWKPGGWTPRKILIKYHK